MQRHGCGRASRCWHTIAYVLGPSHFLSHFLSTYPHDFLPSVVCRANGKGNSGWFPTRNESATARRCKTSTRTMHTSPTHTSNSNSRPTGPAQTARGLSRRPCTTAMHRRDTCRRPERPRWIRTRRRVLLSWDRIRRRRRRRRWARSRRVVGRVDSNRRCRRDRRRRGWQSWWGSLGSEGRILE
jgi:hypothetical protein